MRGLPCPWLAGLGWVLPAPFTSQSRVASLDESIVSSLSGAETSSCIVILWLHGGSKVKNYRLHDLRTHNLCQQTLRTRPSSNTHSLNLTMIKFAPFDLTCFRKMMCFKKMKVSHPSHSQKSMQWAGIPYFFCLAAILQTAAYHMATSLPT